MNIDIEAFLGAYPDIRDNNFYRQVYSKKELYKERLPKFETVESGELLKHQKIISRILSSRTLYDRLLLYHALGSGKTCVTIGTIEQIKREKSSITGAVILAKGDGLLNNFVNELVFKCTKGQYKPNDYERLTEMERTHRINKLVRKFYTLNTFETFGNQINKMSDFEIKKEYSNKVIVIDEVHNIRPISKKEGVVIYDEIHRFLHLIENCKIILMSGTPMKDSPVQISSIMNLLLPLDNQFKSEGEFKDEFFNEISDNVLIMKNEKIPEFKSKIKGLVSFIKPIQSNVVRVFVGEPLADKYRFIVDKRVMSEFQTKYYKQAYIKDTVDKSIYNNSRQATLFVFPDGSYGTDGFKKYVRVIERRIVREEQKLFTYELINELINELKSDDVNVMLSKLERFSATYAETIKNILNSQKMESNIRNRKKSFIYCEYVQGSGCILFSKILELFGFNQANGKETRKEFRYALITNETASSKDIKRMISRFNKPDNLFGEFISVIIGSKVIAEGFSLTNIQEEFILTPHWNYSETEQAIARGLRFGSHSNLIEDGITPIVKIHQCVSIPFNDSSVPSIDFDMYKLSEIKDVSIKGVERIMKENAIDCALNYKRNFISGFDNLRECDYNSCDYSCQDIPMDLINNTIPNSELDSSTYLLYYDEEDMNVLLNKIRFLFKQNFSLQLDNIISNVSDAPIMLIIKTLERMISYNYPIENKYGFVSFLREEFDRYFLVSNINIGSNCFDTFYAKNVMVKTTETFDEIMTNSIPSTIIKLFHSTQEKQVVNFMNMLPPMIQQLIFESCVVARKLNTDSNKETRDMIIALFNHNLYIFKDVYVSDLNADDDNEQIRCLRSDSINWEFCDMEEFASQIEEVKLDVRKKYEQNQYGYYGKYNSEDKLFCIVDTTNKKEGDVVDEDTRKINTGKVCLRGWDKSTLAKLCAMVLKIPIPNDPSFKISTSLTKEELWVLLTQYESNFYKESDLPLLSLDDLRRALYWLSKQKVPMCSAIQQWFKEHDLLQDDPSCGTRGKKKK